MIFVNILSFFNHIHFIFDSQYFLCVFRFITLDPFLACVLPLLATRAQKQRATRSEDALETLNAQILERDQFIEELRSEMENTGSQCDKIAKEKSQMQAENSALNTYVMTPCNWAMFADFFLTFPVSFVLFFCYLLCVCYVYF